MTLQLKFQRNVQKHVNTNRTFQRKGGESRKRIKFVVRKFKITFVPFSLLEMKQIISDVGSWRGLFGTGT